MNIPDIIFRITTAAVFAAISTLFLALSFAALKKKSDTKKNLKISALFATLMFATSFFPNWTAASTVLTLLTIKYAYIKHWKETLAIWGVWNALWILLIILISTVIYLTKPFPAAI